MCLAIPSKITRIEEQIATIDVDGVQRQASLLLLEDAQVGDFVIVHAGFAIQNSMLRRRRRHCNCSERRRTGRIKRTHSNSTPFLLREQ